MDRLEALRCFKAMNQQRIHRLIELAPPQQSIFFQLLPLFFHTYSRGFPGAINKDIPFGIVDYRPSREVIDRARQFDPAFHYQQKALHHYPIRGVYLLSPQGYLYTQRQPQLTLWLIVQDSLSGGEMRTLTSKCEAIQQWAAELGIELQTRVLKEADLHNTQVSAAERELCYSSAVVLAGSLPYWWMIAVEDDYHYREALTAFQAERMLRQDSFIDLGGQAALAAEDIFSAAFQAALACLNDIRTSSLDMLYWSSYLHSALNTLPLSLASLLKETIYQQTDQLAGDSNLLKLAAIERTQDKNFISLARQSLYQLSQERLSQTVTQPAHPWRREFMQQRCADWQWTQQDILKLDQLNRRYREATAYLAQLAQALRTFIALLAEFTSQQQLDHDADITQLQKLYALRFEKQSHAIDCLPLSLRPETLNERLYLYRFKNSAHWQLSQIPLDSETQQALYTHDNLLHVLSWAIANQLLKRSDWLSVTDQQQKVTTSAAVNIAQQLLKSTLAEDDLHLDDSTHNADSADALLLFVNLQQQPQTSLSLQGLHLTSLQNDPLSYSSFKHNLVQTIDGIVRDHNKQWYSFSYSGHSAVAVFLAELLAKRGSAELLKNTQVYCDTPGFAQALELRLTTLIEQCWQHKSIHPDNTRIILRLGHSCYRIMPNTAQAIQQFPQSADLWSVLADEEIRFRPTLLDRYLDPDGLLNLLLQQQRSHQLTVFIYTEQQTSVLYLLDEACNLIRQQYQHLNETTLITHIQRFLTACPSAETVKQIQFYRITRLQQKWFLTAIQPHNTATEKFLPVQVTMASPAADAETQVKCGQKHFSGRADDPDLFAQIRQLVLQLRNQMQHYPIYLDTLNFSEQRAFPSATYLSVKQRLESALNND